MDRRLIVLALLALMAPVVAPGCSDDPASTSEDDRRTELIGVEGGTLRSADELLFVEVPPRAVVASTLFSVESATTAPEGAVSSAYEITPSGRVFDRPLRLVFDASRLETGASLDALRIAVAEDGRWVRQPRPLLDAAAGTLAVETLHLSTWAVVVATCQSDAECLTGESCVAGTCAVKVCGGDVDCVTGVCADGLCGPVPPCEADSDCDAGLSCVAGQCQETPGCQDDAECASGEVCQAGLCQPAMVGCLSDTDCAAGQVCQAGSCVADAPSCQTTDDCGENQVCGPSGDCLCDGGTVMCGASCVDTRTDNAHCGDCDVICDSGARCQDGTCVAETPTCTSNQDCPPGQACDPESGACIDDGTGCTSDADCAAGQVCEQATGVCTPGSTSCGAGELECAGACVDPMTDGTHCGACDQTCGQNEACTDGMCTSTSCANDADCAAGQVCSGNQCVAACTDDADCGSGRICDSSGRCVDSGSPSCTSNSDCLPGQVCEAATGQCVATCASDSDCATGESCVGGLCTQ